MLFIMHRSQLVLPSTMADHHHFTGRKVPKKYHICIPLYHLISTSGLFHPTINFITPIHHYGFIFGEALLRSCVRH